MLNSHFFAAVLSFSVAQPSGVWNEIEYLISTRSSIRSHPNAPLGMHITAPSSLGQTKIEKSKCINCLARFCQCHFSFAYLAIFLFGRIFLPTFAPLVRRLKSLEEEVQKLEEEQQLGHTLSVDFDDVDLVYPLGNQHIPTPKKRHF